MIQTLTVKDMDYLVTDEETITQEDEMIFEVRNRRATQLMLLECGKIYWEPQYKKFGKSFPKQNTENNSITPPP